MELLNQNWKSLLNQEFEKNYYINLQQRLVKEYQLKTIYPNREDVFNALNYTDYHDVKIVILGQDSYHGPNQANGLSFSVHPGVPLPPSLLNIFKELHSDLGCHIPNNGDLTKWAEQGVLLLNTVLTVESGQANSHKNIGWEIFTDKIIDLLNQRNEPVVFILWGNYAQSKIKLITNTSHYIIKSVHPSPLSAYRGFFGSKPFSKANAFLTSINQPPINWQV